MSRLKRLLAGIVLPIGIGATLIYIATRHSTNPEKVTTVEKEIEKDIAEKTAGLPTGFVGAAPPTKAYGGGWGWLLGSTRGFRLKKQAEAEAESWMKAEDFRPPSIIGTKKAEYSLVRWTAPGYLTPKWYVYWKRKIK